MISLEFQKFPGYYLRINEREKVFFDRSSLWELRRSIDIVKGGVHEWGFFNFSCPCVFVNIQAIS